jgi:hypothetical protein
MTGDGGCVVIDMKTRRKAIAAAPKPRPTNYAASDKEARRRVFAQLLPVLEAGVPTIRPGSFDRRNFERMLAACKRGLGDFSDLS